MDTEWREDEYLVSRVEKCAGAHIHQVNQWLCLYKNAIWLYNQKSGDRKRLQEVIEKNEAQLRIFLKKETS